MGRHHQNRELVEIYQYGPGDRQVHIKSTTRIIYCAEVTDINCFYGPIRKKKYHYCIYRDNRYIARPIGQRQIWRIWLDAKEDSDD